MNKPIGFLKDEFGRYSAPGTGGTKIVATDAGMGADNEGAPTHHIRQLLDALPVAIYTTDAAGNITYYNDTAADLWGHRPVAGKWCGSRQLFRPDGMPMAHGECPMAVALNEGRQPGGLEAIVERPDGTRVPFLAYPTPLYDDAGRLSGGVNMMVDITGRKRAEEQQSLLIREVHHRVKNTLANVQAIMGTTARNAGNIEDFKSTLIGRIGSLAKTHLLLDGETRAVSLSELLHKELDAFDDGSEGRVVISGPPVDLSASLAVSLGMALHELITNAAKYGALSVADGKVTTSWRVLIEAQRHTLDFDWVESGGPPVDPPTRQGFGTRLLESVLPTQIRARTEIDYAPGGVRVHYTVPLPTEE